MGILDRFRRAGATTAAPPATAPSSAASSSAAPAPGPAPPAPAAPDSAPAAPDSAPAPPAPAPAAPDSAPPDPAPFSLTPIGSTLPADRPTRDEQLEWLEESARELVAPAFLGRTEVHQLLCEQYAEDDELDLTDSDVESVLERVWGERLGAEATWDDEGDYARVRDAFAALEAEGVVARMSFTCCQTCGHAEIGDEKGAASRGYVFFHQQDAEGLAPGASEVFLAYGGFQVPDEVVAREVVAALTSQGLAVEWDGTASQRVRVTGLDWRKRLPQT